jgi:hypothetical protein
MQLRVDIRLYTVYTPREHADGTVHTTKADALAAGHRSGAVLML